MTELLPLFLNLSGRAVVLVGGGPVATAKLQTLLAAGARVRIVAPDVAEEIAVIVAALSQHAVTIAQRPFEPADLDGAWLVVAAATPAVNRQVAEAAEARRIFVNAVDDPANATAFLSGVIHRDGVTLGISTSGAAPALTALLREGLDALLPRDLSAWMWQARASRVAWRRDAVPMAARKPLLLRALNDLYRSPEGLRHTGENCGEDRDVAQGFSPAISAVPFSDRGPRVPWLNGPEDSWL
jgi:uroporphyrin-III C-methyltransferase/precorrin-2 dehydrogenase/sirohydrochlorin ferrochelatase